MDLDQGGVLHQKLFTEAEKFLSAASAAGASLALLVDGLPVFVEAVGHRDLAGSVPLEPDARFYIYSVTKTLIAAVSLQLVQEEQVALDAPLSDYLAPEDAARLRAAPGDLARVTVRQALNHTGGLPDYGGMRAYHDAVRAGGLPWTAEEFTERVLGRGPLFEPEQGWSYSNIGYLLLRRALETALGGSLQDIFLTRIIAPLKLRNTCAALSLADATGLTPGWSAFYSGGELEDIRGKYHPGWVSHGVVISTAGELARMAEAILAGGMLGAEMRAEMLRSVRVPVEHPLFREPGYGLGVMLDTASPWGLMAGHGGGGPGYSAGVLHLPDWNGHSVTCAALVNNDRGDWGLKLAFTVLKEVGAV
jgi:D-alanyl-D-alanine carboxypeptidase